MPSLGPRAEMLLFAVVVLGLAVFTRRVAWVGVAGVSLYAFSPTLAALIVILLARRVGPRGWMSLGLDRLGLPAWPVAFLLPLVALGSAIVVAWALHLTDLRIPNGMPLPNYLAAAFLIVVRTSLLSLGEEIGWRGFLLPRLAVYGRVRAGLVLGLLWEAWHIVLIGFHPAHVVGVLLIAFAMNEVAMATRSVWPAALFHGANNAIADLTGGLTVNANSALSQVAGTAGIVTIAVYGIAALAIVTLRPPWSRGLAARDPLLIDRLPAPGDGR